MTAKPIVPREQANRDIDEAIAYYLSEDAEQAALGFIDAVEQAYAHISLHPATGSSRYAHELNLPRLRWWPLTRYPIWCSTLSVLITLMFGAYCTAYATSRHGCRNPTTSDNLPGQKGAFFSNIVCGIALPSDCKPRLQGLWFAPATENCHPF